VTDFVIPDDPTAYSFSISGPAASAITISGIVTVWADGEVEFLNGHAPKEAALGMWVALGGFMRQSTTAENVRLRAEIERLNALLGDNQSK